MEKNSGPSKLNLRQPKHLAAMLDVSLSELNDILSDPKLHYREFILIDPDKTHKVRTVISARNPLRRLQGKFYRRVLLPKLIPSPHSHGGVVGRSIKTNAGPHIGNSLVYKTDIANFYPTIHSTRVYRLFCDSLGCSPDVARLCTKLCTFNHHLALGLVTSPVLADQILRIVDLRIAGVARKLGITYTRFVDDITITATFDLANSGFPALVREILKCHGFRVQKSKDVFGELKQIPVAGIRLRKSGRLDVAAGYLGELLRLLEDLRNLGEGREFQGPYYLRSQVLGKIQFCSWVNPNRKPSLLKRFRRINWKRCAMEARNQSMRQHKVRLIPKSESQIEN